MPRRDGTGPEGFGPMTGRGMGPCGGYNSRGFFGRRRRRFWNYCPVEISKDEKRTLLNYEKEDLERELERVNDSLARLEKEEK